MDASRATILVLPTGQRAAQATARSLARAGYRVLGGWEGGRLTGKTRYCDQLVRIPPPGGGAAFLAAVRDLCVGERARAILPLSDEFQVALLQHPDAAAGAVVVGPSLEEFARLCDKVGLLETARRVGVATPASIVVRPGAELGDLPPLPAYVKVVTSIYGGRPAGRPLRVTDAAECARAVERSTQRGDTVLVQEEVDAPHWRYYFARRGATCLQLAARQIADHPRRVAQSSVLEFCDVPGQLEEASRRLLDAGGYEGVGSIQWIERDGEWLVHDVNLRMPANVAGPIAACLDLPVLAVEHALAGTSAWPAPAKTPVDRYVWLPGELSTLLSRAAAGGARSRGTILRTLLQAAISPRQRVGPSDLSDPLPMLAALAAAVRRR